MNPKCPRNGNALWIVLGIVAACIVAFVLFIGGIAWYYSNRAGSMQIWVEDTATGETRKLTTEGLNAFPSLSRAGDRVAYSSRPGVRSAEAALVVRPLAGENEEALVAEGFNTSPAWGKDDAALYFLSRRNGATEVYAYSFAEGAARALTSDGAPKRDLAIAPDGEHLAYLAGEADAQGLFVLPTAGGEARKLFTAGTLQMPRHPAWTLDSKAVHVLSFTSILRIDLDGGSAKAADLVGLDFGNLEDIVADPRDGGASW